MRTILKWLDEVAKDAHRLYWTWIVAWRHVNGGVVRFPRYTHVVRRRIPE